MTTQTELAELVESLRLHWIDQTQDEEADAEEKCCYLIGTAAADTLEHQATRIAELEKAPQQKPLTDAQLRKAAQALVDRWDTPLWKDAPATADYINELRKALK